MAIALTKGRKDIKVDIYEAATQPSEIGLGAGIWRIPADVLRSLGFGRINNATDIPTDEHDSMIRVPLNRFMLTHVQEFCSK